MFKVVRKKAIVLNAIHGFKGIAYDGFYFYLTVKDENVIEKYDISFNHIESFETCRCFMYICYDPFEDCFWATDRENSLCIYKLNTCFEPIDEINISIPGGRGKKINGIALNCKPDKLLISFTNMILSIDKCSLNVCRVLYSNNKRIQGVTDIFSTCISYGITRPKQQIQISSLDGRVFKRINIPNCSCIESMVSVPSVRKCGVSNLYVLITHRNKEQFIWNFIVEDCEKCEHERCCNEALNSIATEGDMIAHCLKVESLRLINIINCSNNTWEINKAMALLSNLIDRVSCQEKELTDMLQKLMEHCDFCDELESYEDED